MKNQLKMRLSVNHLNNAQNGSLFIGKLLQLHHVCLTDLIVLR